MGGITEVEDAIQMIAVGAQLYGVGTGILYHGIDIFNTINTGIDEYLREKNLQYDDLVGIVHKQ